MLRIKKHYFVLASLLLPINLLANSNSNFQDEEQSSRSPNHNTGSCLKIVSSETESLEREFDVRAYGWKVELINTCQWLVETDVVFDWLDVNGSSVGKDSDTGILIEKNGTAIARSSVRLSEEVILQIANHSATVSSTKPFNNSVAKCLRITSSAAGRTVGSRIAHYSWRTEIENSCNVDLFTTVNFRGISPTTGYVTLRGPRQPVDKEDVFVPANGSSIAFHKFRYNRDGEWRGTVDYEFRLLENSIPEYSNQRVAIRSQAPAQFIYDTATELLTLPIIVDDHSLVIEATFTVLELRGNYYYLLDTNSVRTLENAPLFAALYSSRNGKLRIPSVAADDGSFMQFDLDLKFHRNLFGNNVYPELSAFRLNSYSGDPLIRSGYSLDGDSCIEIESVESERGYLGGVGVGPPALLMTVEVSNRCQTDRQVQFKYWPLTREGLIVSRNLPSSQFTELELIPAQSTKTITRYELTAAVERLVGEFEFDLVEIHY